jgi:hypothetical protein
MTNVGGLAGKYKCRCGAMNTFGTPGKTSRGLGDTIRKITTALHIPHCGGCEQRQEALNKMFPYK